MRNNPIDGTKFQSLERKGNLFCLLCIASTTSGSAVMKRSLKLSEQRWKKFIDFLKLYLGIEEWWFHDSNDKCEVQGARAEIAKVLRSLQQYYTNGYNIQNAWNG
jgi:hypothetical protein